MVEKYMACSILIAVMGVIIAAYLIVERRKHSASHALPTDVEALVKDRTQKLQAAMQDMVRSYDITLEALGGALDLKDAESEGHSRRVTAFTMAIAKTMGLPSDLIMVIARGAFLHDIGKMAIPDAILHKPGALTPDEVAILRKHCYHGYQILTKIPFLREAAEIVYAHHERYDGSGYPRGLKGGDIPIGARIFAVADTLDAITSDRRYHAARTVSAARAEIERCSGTQFDPEVVKAFLMLHDSIWEGLRSDLET